MKLNSILNLSPNFVQIVSKPTRIDPKTGSQLILDPVIMTLSTYYQEPICLDPLDSDPDKNGTKSDHRIVICRPINVINNRPARITRKVKVRPITESGIEEMRKWLMDHTLKEAIKIAQQKEMHCVDIDWEKNQVGTYRAKKYHVRKCERGKYCLEKISSGNLSRGKNIARGKYVAFILIGINIKWELITLGAISRWKNMLRPYCLE